MFKEKKGVDLSMVVMSRIEKENIKMKSRFYFSAIHFAKKAGIFFLIVLCAYLFSLVVFKISIYNPFGFLKFGSAGVHAFLLAFPSIFLVLALTFFLILRAAVSRYGLIYKKSFSYVTLNLLVFVFAAGFLLNTTGINSNFKDNGKLPVIYHGEFVTEYGVMGKVISINEGEKRMSIVTPNGEKVEILWNNETNFPIRQDFYTKDYIQAIGHLKDSFLFEAQGIRPYSP